MEEWGWEVKSAGSAFWGKVLCEIKGQGLMCGIRDLGGGVETLDS
jgi:hypothetical protein